MQDSNIYLSIDNNDNMCTDYHIYYYDCCDVNNFDGCPLLTSCLDVYHNNYVLITEYCVMTIELHDFQFSIACTAQSKTCGGYDHIGKPFI